LYSFRNLLFLITSKYCQKSSFIDIAIYLPQDHVLLTQPITDKNIYGVQIYEIHTLDLRFSQRCR